MKPTDRDKPEDGVEEFEVDFGSTGPVPVLNFASTADAAEKGAAAALTDWQTEASEGPVDAKALATLVDGDWVFARALVRVFSDTTDHALKVLAAALSFGDHLALRDAAVAIKDASANVFTTLAALEAEQLEDAARLGDVGEMRMCAGSLNTEVAKAVAYLKAWMELHEP